MKTFRILACGLIAGLAASSQAGEIADAAADYTETAPSNGWTYLRSDDASGGTETALDFVAALPGGGGMTANPGYTGNATRNGRPFPVIVGSVADTLDYEIFGDGDHNGGTLGTDLLFHPGDNTTNYGDQYVIARYTVSAADIAANGTIATLTGSFRNLIPGGDNSVEVYVYHNAALLFSALGDDPDANLLQATGTFTGVATATDFTVAAGDTISFVVGSRGNIAADETALIAGISLATPLVLTIARDGSDLDFEWNSRAGMLYNLKSSPDLATWTLVEGDIPADPPANTKTIPRPADPALFYRVAEYPIPPVVVFSENFDGVVAPALPTGWTSGANTPPDTGTTAWELGAPANVGPATANSPDNCCATNLSADYGFDTDIWLRTPAIDLTAHTVGTLEFKEFKDIEDAAGDFDFGTVRILAADDLEELAVLTAAVEGTSGKWEDYSEALPATAFDEPVIIEFQFQADDIDNFAGWYIDDVTISVPAS